MRVIYNELREVLSELEKPPEAKRLLPAEVFDSLHKASSVESESTTVEGETISQPEHNTSSVHSKASPSQVSPLEEKDISDSEQKTG